MKLTFEDIAIKDKKGYFYSYELNGLFEVDMNSFNCELLYSYDCSSLCDDVRLFGAIKYIDGVIILAPMKASHIVLFSLKDKKSKYLEIPEVDVEYNEFAKFYSMATRGKDCYLIGHAYPGILKVNIDEIVKKIEIEKKTKFENIKVVANLPYYITTPIIFKLLEDENSISDITVMVQKEVAERMVAESKSKNFGILTIMVDYFSNANIELIVPNSSFIPEPGVVSAVINLKKTRKYSVKNEKLFFLS